MIPSKYQQVVFDWVSGGTGHAVINAVAGSGKTTTIVEAAKLIPSQARVLFCAFNKHIEAELSRRLPRTVCVRTIHGIGYGAIAQELGRLRVDDRKLDLAIGQAAKAILRDAEKRAKKRDDDDVPALGTIVAAVRKMTHFARVTLCPTTIEDLSVMADYYQIDVGDDWLEDLCAAVSDMLALTRQIAERDRVIDFDDMIYLPAAMKIRPAQYDFVTVDEAQDLSAAQRALVLSCVAPTGRILAVGDPHQSIQGFAGADPESFAQLQATLGAVSLPLSICYRCPPNHLTLARAYVPHVEAVEGREDGGLTEIKTRDLHTVIEAGDLVISRRTAPLIGLCLTLIARRIPARVKGKDIGAALAKDVEDIGGMRGFKWAQFGKYATKWAESRKAKLMAKGADDSRIDAIDDRLAGILAVFEGSGARNPAELADAIRGLFDDASRGVTLSTIHRSKGLEADRVFVVESERLPFRFRKMLPWQAFQEECLAYVAMTRSKRDLFLIVGGDDE